MLPGFFVYLNAAIFPALNTFAYKYVTLSRWKNVLVIIHVQITVGVTHNGVPISALKQSLQHHEGEEPRYGGRGEEEVCDEASSGGSSGNQENLFC